MHVIGSKTSSSSSWAGWFSSGFAKVAGNTTATTTSRSGTNGDYNFPSSQGMISVREESRLNFLHGTVTRARSTQSVKREYDLRRLQGMRLDVEVELTEEIGRHPNVQHCLSIIEAHDTSELCRLLLCEPCLHDLQFEIDKEIGSSLPLGECLAVGEQVALGLGHLHALSILYGGVDTTGILRGSHGLWKLADFSRSARLPITLEEWRGACPIICEKSLQQTPPELRGARGDEQVEASLDVWSLGALLANLLLGKFTGGQPRGQDQELAAGVDLLESPLAAQLWILLHSPLAAHPRDRPLATGFASTLGAITNLSARDILNDMPATIRRQCFREASSIARQYAVEQVVEEAQTSDARHVDVVNWVATSNLGQLYVLLKNRAGVRRICENCGFLPWEDLFEEETEEAGAAHKQTANDKETPQVTEFEVPPVVVLAVRSKKNAGGGIEELSTDSGSSTDSDSDAASSTSSQSSRFADPFWRTLVVGGDLGKDTDPAPRASKHQPGQSLCGEDSIDLIEP